MNGKCIDKNPLQRDGTSQQQRIPDWLQPDAVRLHAFTPKDWLKYAYQFAKELRYFNTELPDFPEGNWQTFFVADDRLDEFLAQMYTRQDTEPHLALFVAFLKLLATSQEQLNGITRRHLDFYYREILQFEKRDFVPDQVFVVFELAKNVMTHRLEKGTLLDGGKDALKRNIQYGLQQELVVNTALAEQFKTIFHQKGHALCYADNANSADGIGGPLDPADPGWFAFGQDGSVPGFASLPLVRTGFALASGVLLMKEGKRNIKLQLTLEIPSDFDTSVFLQLATDTTALLTGDKGWIQLAIISASVTKSGLTATFSMELELAAKDDAVAGYTALLHQEQYTTDLPVLRLLWEALPGAGYDIYVQLAKARLVRATIDIAVTDLKTFQAENDQGVVDVSKPFLPFGTQPGGGSSFYLGSTEIFSKNWTDIALNIEWKDLPEDLSDHYLAYQKRFLTPELTRQKYNLTATSGDTNREVQNDGYFNVEVSYVKEGMWLNPPINKPLFLENPISISSTPSSGSTPYFHGLLFQTGANQNKWVIQQYFQTHYSPVYQPYVPVYNLFTFNPGFLIPDYKNEPYHGNIKNNFLRIRLIQDFLHQHFPRLYAVAMSVEGGDALIPHAPYTPLIAALSINYTATASNDFVFSGSQNTAVNKLNDYRNRTIQLFHEAPFGQAAQHVFLREQVYPESIAGHIRLLPGYPVEAGFFLGLKNAVTGSLVSILFQVAEGSENPAGASFTNDKQICWYGLGNNEWKDLGTGSIIRDTTNNFLRSGIITFRLPPHMTDSNTLMPAGYHWLMATLPEGLRFDSVCRFTAVYAQAAAGLFQNNNNDLAHLEGALPGNTISKLVDRPAQIKKVNQPGASFDGSPQETDAAYYTRVSERLRHKNRAVSIWDYERLILNEFPAIYKVKCLNHTSSVSGSHPGHEIDPGYVSLIPIPDVRNRHLYDALQPRVSNNLLREIEAYMSRYQSMHIRFAAAHPRYEPVRFSFKVKFHQQYDQHTYRELLNQLLTQYLAPWTSQEQASIVFGGILYKTVVISFIEEQEYVDYVTDFKMYGVAGTDQSSIVAGTSRSILTSVAEHSITVITEASCSS